MQQEQNETKKIYVVGGGPVFVRDVQRRFVEEGYGFTSLTADQATAFAAQGSQQALLIVDPKALGLVASLKDSGVALLTLGIPAEQVMAQGNDSVRSLDGKNYTEYVQEVESALKTATLRKRGIEPASGLRMASR